MKKRTQSSAGILCSSGGLSEIYNRQFLELTRLRKHICSLLPLRQVRTIFEPGCGTGLLGKHIKTLTDAVYTGMDKDRRVIPKGREFVVGDAVKNPAPADLYVASFFLSSVDKPAKWLTRVRKVLSPRGLFAVFAEYDYSSIGESPDTGLADMVRAGLERHGINTENGSRLDFLFSKAGFSKLAGGELQTSLQTPDRAFIEMHTGESLQELPLMSWSVIWGIWRSSRE